MRYAFAVSFIVATQVAAAQAQTADPYAADVAQAAKERRQRRHDDFMQRVDMLSYAAGCKVVAQQNAEAAIVYSYIAQARILGSDQPNITREEMARTLLRNPEIAAERGCEFWKKNPDLVLEFRQSVADRRMP